MKENIIEFSKYLNKCLSYTNSNGEQKTTNIVDFTIKQSGRLICLTIMGKDFSYGFELSRLQIKDKGNGIIYLFDKNRNLMIDCFVM